MLGAYLLVYILVGILIADWSGITDGIDSASEMVVFIITYPILLIVSIVIYIIELVKWFVYQR